MTTFRKGKFAVYIEIYRFDSATLESLKKVLRV